MTRKRLIALFSIVFIIFLFVFSATFFTLQNVYVFFVTSTNYSYNHASIIDAGKFLYGKSLFLQDKASYIANIEKAYSYLKVEKIETKFPNKFVVHMSERIPVYVLINESSDDYYILDQELKVLDIIKSEDYVTDYVDIKPIPISISNYSIVYDQFGEGDIVQLSVVNDICNTFITSLNSYDYDRIAVQNLVKSIDYDMLTNQMTIKTYYGIEILLDDATKMLDEKIGYAFSGYEELKADNKSDYAIFVTSVNDEIFYEIRGK